MNGVVHELLIEPVWNRNSPITPAVNGGTTRF